MTRDCCSDSPKKLRDAKKVALPTVPPFDRKRVRLEVLHISIKIKQFSVIIEQTDFLLFRLQKPVKFLPLSQRRYHSFELINGN